MRLLNSKSIHKTALNTHRAQGGTAAVPLLPPMNDAHIAARIRPEISGLIISWCNKLVSWEGHTTLLLGLSRVD